MSLYSSFHPLAAKAVSLAQKTEEQETLSLLSLDFKRSYQYSFEEALKNNQCPIGQFEGELIFASTEQSPLGLKVQKSTLLTLFSHVYRKDIVRYAEYGAYTGSRWWVEAGMFIRLCVFFTILYIFSSLLHYVSAVIWLYLLSSVMLFFGVTRAFFTIYGALIRTPQHTPLAIENLPKISLLIPLYNEAKVVKRLIRRLNALDYPHSKLECFFILEEKDITTQTAVNALVLPEWIHVLILPKGSFYTKPRALNAALPFVAGEIIGVYDAEDAPQKTQLIDAATELASHEGYACVQAPLDYYNADSNSISRLFTLEYAAQFRGLLPFLAKFNYPIPLGGTSFFIKREILQKIGPWDAYNVTEDAELGLALSRSGYKIGYITSATFEEANFRIKPWINQRSRWLKGFLQTWISLESREKLKFWSIFHLLAPVVSFVVTGAIVCILLMELFMKGRLFGDGFEWVYLSYCALTVEVSLAIATFATTCTRHLRAYRFMIILMPFYRILGIPAVLKALYELIVKPHKWAKTEHGINDDAYGDVIADLTHPLEA